MKLSLILKKSLVFISLIFFIASGISPVDSKISSEESLRVVNLPAFRHNKNYIELQEITTLDLLLQPSAKIVLLEVNGADTSKIEIDKKSGRVFGLEIVPLQRLKRGTIRNNKIYHKRNNKVINKTKFNLDTSLVKPLLIEDEKFKILKVPVRGVFSGSYTLKAVIDGAQEAVTTIITKENFRIDSISPSVINAGVESELTILGKGFDIFTDVSFYDPNGKQIQVTDILEIESLDKNTLKVRVLIPEDYTPGFHNVTITNSLSPNETSTLLNGIYIGSTAGVTGVGVCDDPKASLMINAIELLPEGESSAVFDPTLCQLTVTIPTDMNGLPLEELDVSPDINNSAGFCDKPKDKLMVFTNNLNPGSQASAFFDPVQCNLTFAIPVGFNGNNGENGSNGLNGANGMGLCNDRNATPTTMTITLPAGSTATIDLNPVACTITYGIPQGETGSQGQKGFSCWDLNSNRTCDLTSEDKNRDGECNPFDCEGASGENGIDCWDLNENRAKDLNEDVNRDGFVDVKDCIGATGEAGTTGVNGLNSLVKTTDEPSGLNCTTGGKKIQSGLDFNNNSVLDSSEVSQTEYVCNGVAGSTGATGASGLNSLVKTTDESAGLNCTAGGKKVQTGIDLNNDGVLASSEALQTEYVCNGIAGSTGATGASGLNSLVSTTNELAGLNCTAGGKKVQTGIDLNNNTVLDSSEVSQIAYVCNGENGEGLNSLVSTIDELPGSNCDIGGVKIQSGLDSNNNNILDSFEVLQIDYVCNGVTGETGLAGINCWDLNGNRIDDSNEDINMDGLFNTYDCNSPQIKLLEEIIVDWVNDSADQNFTTVSGDMTRMIKIPYFIHDGIIYGGFWIDKYEASRADASSIAEGTSSIPISKRNVIPWTNVTLAEAKTAASGRQITDIGGCHLIKMREWYALYLLGRYTKEKGVLGATATSGWNERGNTRSGQDGRNNLLFSCADDPTENTINPGRCLTGTGYKSWGHFLDSTAVSNIGLGVSPGFGALVSADLVKDDGDGSGTDTFDGDFQVYDLVGNIREWIDFTVTRTSSGTIIDPTYQGANEALPFTTTNRFFSFENVANSSDSSQIDFEGLGLPASGSSSNITDLNGGANDGKLFTSSTNQQYGTVRGGSWTTHSNSRSPLYLNISTSPTTQEHQRGFRTTCGF